MNVQGNDFIPGRRPVPFAGPLPFAGHGVARPTE